MLLHDSRPFHLHISRLLSPLPNITECSDPDANKEAGLDDLEVNGRCDDEDDCQVHVFLYGSPNICS